MTPLHLARQHCANYQPDGSCLGACFDDEGRHHSCKPKPGCGLATLGVRCAYLEECVIPTNTQGWPSHKAQEFVDAVRDYLGAAQVGSRIPSRLCPQCKERQLDWGRRFCEVCRAENRRRSTRLSMARNRGAGVSS